MLQGPLAEAVYLGVDHLAVGRLGCLIPWRVSTLGTVLIDFWRRSLWEYFLALLLLMPLFFSFTAVDAWLKVLPLPADSQLHTLQT